MLTDFGEDDRNVFLVTDFIEGPSLRQAMAAAGAMPWPRAIGVVAYQMVTARLPFKAASLPELMGQMLQTKPPAPSAFNADIPEAASAAIVKAIDGNLANRFDSAQAFAQALRAES